MGRCLDCDVCLTRIGFRWILESQSYTCMASVETPCVWVWVVGRKSEKKPRPSRRTDMWRCVIGKYAVKGKSRNPDIS